MDILGRVLTIALGALALAVGAFSTIAERMVLGIVILVFLGYKIHRERHGFRFELVKENLLHLFPGHLLLLLALSLQKNFSADSWMLLGIWSALVALTIALDLSSNALGADRWVLLAGLYCLVLAGVFYLIWELLVRSEKLSGQSDFISLVMSIVGGIYLALAVYRFYKVRPAAS